MVKGNVIKLRIANCKILRYGIPFCLSRAKRRIYEHKEPSPVFSEDYEKLTTLAKQSYSAVAEAKKLKEENRRLSSRIWSLESEVSRLRTTLSELKEKCKPYLDALKAAPKAVKEFIDGILEKFKKQEKDIMYDPIPADKPLPQRKPKSKDYER